MPFVNKNRSVRTHSKFGKARVNKTRRWIWFDRIDSVTIPWFGGRKTIWERSR